MDKKTILLIDDDKTVLDSLRSQLQGRFGYQYIYETVQSVEEAWEVIEDFQSEGAGIQLIISDWLMGPERGDKFLMEVHAKHPGIDLLMLSGYANEEAVERARTYANLKAFVRKPWDEEELNQILENILVPA